MYLHFILIIAKVVSPIKFRVVVKVSCLSIADSLVEKLKYCCMS